MAKIIKVGSTNPTFTSQKIDKSYKTSRNSNATTNPFKFTNFEGNTLQFADVFEGFKPSFKANKMRMIATSVTGSMNKMKSGFESIANFARRIHGGFVSAWSYCKDTWTYCKETDIMDTPMVKGMNEAIANLGTGISNRISGMANSATAMGSAISSKMSYLNKDFLGVAKDLNAKLVTLTSKLHARKYATPDMEVKHIEQLWRDQIALELGEAV